VWGNFRLLKGSKTKDLGDSGRYWENYFRFREEYVRKLPLILRSRFTLLLYKQTAGKWLSKKGRSLKYYKSKVTGKAS
jgi:hypothetical protein